MTTKVCPVHGEQFFDCPQCVVDSMPPSGWITDRNPVEQGHYLVTQQSPDGATDVSYEWWSLSLQSWSGRGDTLAWMPLPEPWKGSK